MNIEAQAIQVVSRLAPWLAPLPTAYIVGDRAHVLLHFPWWVAIIAGVAIECAGLAILVTALDLWGWNRSKRKVDPAAPIGLAILLVVGYTLSALLLTVLMDALPKSFDGAVTIADWSPAVFPFLSLFAMTTLALRKDHAQRLEEVRQLREREKDERRLAREARKERELLATLLPEPAPAPLPSFPCPEPGCNLSFTTQHGVNAHRKLHRHQIASIQWEENDDIALSPD